MNYSYSTTETKDAVLAKGGPMLFGIWVECISHAETFHLTQAFLVKRLNISAKTLTKYIKMLCDMGLAQTVRVKGASGQFIGTRWVFANHPQQNWLEPEQAEIFPIDRNVKIPTLQKLPFENNTKIKNNNNIKLEEESARQGAQSSNDKRPSESEKTDAFARWYEIYPRKQDRKRALNVFMRLTKGKTREQLETFTDTITTNVLQRSQYDAQWLRTIATNKSSIPYAKAYLSAERWTDLYEPNLNSAPAAPESDLDSYIRHGGTIEEYFARN